MARAILAALSATLVAYACSAGDDSNGVEAGATGGASTTGGANATGGTNSTGGANVGGGEGGGGGASGERPYANVTAVSVTGEPGSYSFSVTVESADIDCTLYADWWEVLSQDGALLYRRILEHSHTDENGTSDLGAPGNTFTRAGGPVEIAADDVVIVRAHMNVEGYRGVVQRGSAEVGFTPASDIGSDFASDVEDEPPLPAGCLF